MRLLVACERSGIVRDAFRERGINAWSCDLVRTGDRHHIQADCREVLSWGWDMMIAHPPCTYLCRAGACQKPAEHLVESAGQFALLLWKCDIPRVVIENPEGKARRYLGMPSQIIHPWQFGEPFTKKTLLWIRGLPPLFSTKIVRPSGSWVAIHRSQSIRSRTFAGIAASMADQWSSAS